VIAPAGAGQQEQETLLVHCGAGQQILRWLGTAACVQLAARRGGVAGAHVPQAVLKADGSVLDADLVLSEVAGDGDVLHVEYGSGPRAFTARCVAVPAACGAARQR
jgi:hypothetical protein